MSRAEAHGAYRRESHSRLLRQVYAYVGIPEVAERALSDAFDAAARHWRKVEHSPDRDAWVRERAFAATARARNQSRKPWYVNAKSTADEHRRLLATLSVLRPADRKLVILSHLAGLDVAAAGREVGMTDDAARTSLAVSTQQLAAAGVDVTDAGLADAFASLRSDLAEDPPDAGTASRLRRQGERRRRSRLLLAGIPFLALVIAVAAAVAAAVTALRTPADTREGRATTPSLPAVAPKTSLPVSERVHKSALAGAADVATLDRSRPWTVESTSSDFGHDASLDACLATAPSERRIAHHWVRQFSSGRGDNPVRATQSLQVAQSSRSADAAYSRLVSDFTTCGPGGRQVSRFGALTGVGDGGTVLTLRYAADELRQEHVAIVHTGAVVMAWIVRPTARHDVSPDRLGTLAARSTDAVCTDAAGGCSTSGYHVVAQAPPPADRTNGFLETVDLPVFAGVPQPWVATAPKTIDHNPAATECDRADFASGGARTVRSRSFVIPTAHGLPSIFGMSETIGTFPSVRDARGFMVDVSGAVANCADRRLPLTVSRSDTLTIEGGHGWVWRIELAASKRRSVDFRVGLLRVDTTVAQVTFTPAQDFDVTKRGYLWLTKRAAERLAQL